MKATIITALCILAVFAGFYGLVNHSPPRSDVDPFADYSNASTEVAHQQEETASHQFNKQEWERSYQEGKDRAEKERQQQVLLEEAEIARLQAHVEALQSFMDAQQAQQTPAHDPVAEQRIQAHVQSYWPTNQQSAQQQQLAHQQAGLQQAQQEQAAMRAQLQRDNEKIRKEMEALRFQQEQNAAYQQRKIRQMEEERFIESLRLR
jgi:hypothetical protein